MRPSESLGEEWYRYSDFSMLALTWRHCRGLIYIHAAVVREESMLCEESIFVQ